MISRMEWLKRVMGLKGGQFRQTGMFGSNIIVGCVLGIISGKYIFEEPLQRYWAEKNAAAANALGNGSSSSSGSSGAGGNAAAAASSSSSGTGAAGGK